MSEIKQPIKKRPDDDTYRVLVLDQEDNIKELTLACQLDGHEVVPILSISQGMKFLNSKDHVDIVISAVHLENESVFDFFREIRAMPEHKDVRFMMVCSDPTDFAKAVNESVKIAAEVMGVDKYLMMEKYDVLRLMKELTAMLPDRLPRKEEAPEGAY